MKKLFTFSLSVLTGVTCYAVEFEKDVLPIFNSNCAKCHMDGNNKGGVALDLDKIEREIGSGKAIIPGEVDKGDLIELVSLPEDDGDRMPPKGRPLNDRELATLKEWIAAGAPLTGPGTPTVAKTDEPEPTMAKRPEPIAGSWTNQEGKAIQATLLRVEGDKAVLQLANGKLYHYPIGNLSVDSQAIVKSFAAGS